MRQKRDAKNSISYSRCLSWIIYMKTISVGAFWFRLSLLSLVSHPLCFGFSLNNAIDMRNRNGSWSGRFVIRFKIPIFYFCRSTEDREIECIFFSSNRRPTQRGRRFWLRFFPHHFMELRDELLDFWFFDKILRKAQMKTDIQPNTGQICESIANAINAKCEPRATMCPRVCVCNVYLYSNTY